MVSGVVPSTSFGLEGLRDELAKQGYSKVGLGQAINVPWMAAEIRRIHANDPAARFVLLGYDVGSPAAGWLANDLAAAGIPVDALVLLNPVGKGSSIVRTVVVNCGKAASASDAESIGVADGNHFTLPTHTRTVAIVSSLLATTAAHTSAGQITSPVVEWNFQDEQPRRPLSTPTANSPTEWNFLHDVMGNHNEPLAPVNGSVVIPKSGSQSLAPGLHSNQAARLRP
jgi:hypothetical protein